MFLDSEQKQSLMERGFVVLRDVVPLELVERALMVVNHGVGEGMDPAKMPIYRAQSYVPELQVHPAVTGLFYETRVKDLTDNVFGVDALNPVTKGQITIRFPVLEQKGPRQYGGHIDGIPTATNGVKPGTIASFTALVGVCLTPTMRTDAGNFTVWPGTHLKLAEYFRDKGGDHLLSGMPAIDYGQPLPVQCNPGDIVLAHYLLTHSTGINYTPYPRYKIFFRLKHREHHQWPDPGFSDLWSQWPGLKL